MRESPTKVLLRSPRIPARGRLRIAIVAPDALGPVRNGGVGTATWEIATLLSRAGHGVTVFFAPVAGTHCEDFDTWQKLYLSEGVALLSVPSLPIVLECQLPLRRSYAIYEYLRQFDLDLIHFPDMHGLGYFTFVAKKLGLDFQSTVLVTGAHGPNSWHKEFNGEGLKTEDEVFMDFMEKMSFGLADQLIASHSSILEWAQQRDWKLGGEASIIPLPYRNCRPQKSLLPLRSARELVFFGRLEHRKGLDLFCDALEQLSKCPGLPEKVSFLGKPGSEHGQDAAEWIRRRSEAWPFRTTILSEMDREAALTYLESGPRVAVFPTRAETFGYAFEECLRLGIPFVAAPLPVFLERVSLESQMHCFYDGSVEGLAQKLRDTVARGLEPARAALDPERVEEKWLAWHENARSKSQRRALLSGETPLVSICMSHRNRAEFLAEAIRSIEAQTYPRIELIVSDDASDSPASKSYLDHLEKEFLPKGWKVLRHAKRSGPGKARNHAVSEATGEYVLIMDDDNLAKPDEVETFVQAALSSDADILTCFFDRISEAPENAVLQAKSRWLCMGPDLSAGFLANAYGDMNCLVRRSVFLELGGIYEGSEAGCEDWEFFGRAVAKGFKLLPVPRALFFYRDHASGRSRRVDPVKSLGLARSTYRLALPSGSLTPLISYLSNQCQPSPFQHASQTGVASPPPTFGATRGNDLYLNECDFQRTLFVLSDPGGHDRVRSVRDSILEWGSDGLRIEASGSDPGIEISGIELNGATEILVEIDLESSNHSHFQVFFRTSSFPEYNETQSVRHVLRPGMNHLRFRLRHPEIQGPFRIDPAENPGSYRIREMSFRCES